MIILLIKIIFFIFSSLFILLLSVFICAIFIDSKQHFDDVYIDIRYPLQKYNQDLQFNLKLDKNFSDELVIMYPPKKLAIRNTHQIFNYTSTNTHFVNIEKLTLFDCSIEEMEIERIHIVGVGDINMSEKLDNNLRTTITEQKVADVFFMNWFNKEEIDYYLSSENNHALTYSLKKEINSMKNDYDENVIENFNKVTSALLFWIHVIIVSYIYFFTISILGYCLILNKYIGILSYLK